MNSEFHGAGRFGGLPSEDAVKVAGILDQYMEQLEGGGQPDTEGLLTRYPEFAEVLHPYLRELDLLHQAAASGLGAALTADEESGYEPNQKQGRLGDFRLLREVGRGGMGIVYEAEQMSLNRRVALKVLPFAATLDAKQLLRFKNEARAAAHLHHPHIVPVYGVGAERGVHYYAMQYIDGQNLAEIVADLRRTTVAPALPATPPASASAASRLSTLRSTDASGFFEAVAAVGEQAAQALDYAHQLGFVHRDIKPANLLMDATGHLWITDFGLATCRADQGLTLTGDAVGTLRYMSPEQAFAKRGLVDYRSDIYALGLTLYEVLTLEPAYTGSDREELLHQLATSEPRPLRRLNPAIPVELETIVLKAMARQPERRYHSAQELADDLDSFRNHRPIRARRPSWSERATRWARRHQSLVVAAVFTVILAVACLVGSTVLIWHEKEQTKAALWEAKTQSWRARANFDKALRGSMHIMMRLEDKRWDNIQPVIKELHRDVINETLKLFRGFVNADSHDPTDRYEAARLYDQMATIYCYLKQYEQTNDLVHRSVRLFEGLVAAEPDNFDYRLELARTYRSLGDKMVLQKRGDDAHQAYAQAVQEYHQVLARACANLLNEFAWFIAICHDRQVVNAEEGVALAKQAVEREPSAGHFWNTLGIVEYRAGNWSAAISALQRSMALRDGGDGYDWFFLAMAYWQLGDKEQARHWYDKGIKALESLRPEEYELPGFKREATVVLGLDKPGSDACPERT